MRVLRTLLRPGWIALVIVVVAFAAACFMILAPWQLGKNASTSERNELIKHAVATGPVPLSEVAPAGAPFVKSTEWREVTVTGTYVTEEQALVRLRSAGERPAIEVLTPFRVTGTDRVLAVDRGYVRPDQSQTPVIPTPPAGQVTITARIRASEGTSEGRGARVEDGALTVYTIDPAELSTATGTAMDPFYLQLSPDQPGSLGEIPLPQLDSGPYLSYGLQWLAFGIMAPLGVGYFLYSEIRQRRRSKAAAGSAAAAATPSASGPETSDSATPVGDGGVLSRSERRKRLRAELRNAGGAPVPEAGSDDDASMPAGIGVGPDTEHTVGVVRDKLTQRYGG
ncbi:SURF1 family cytochrome oxidase biogenesis protein [Gordonia sp. NPDC003376]